MRSVYQVIDAVAPSNASVLILGESGTGKELVARAVHSKSERVEGAVLRAQLRGAAQGDPRERIVRPREGRLHRIDQREAGRVRDGERRHDLPRRSRRDVAGHSGQAPSRARDAAGAAARRQKGDHRRHPHRRGDEQGLAEGDAPTANCARTSTIVWPSWRSCCRRCASGPHDVQLLATEFLARYASQNGKQITDFEHGGLGLGSRVPLAGERARAQECRRAVGDHGAGRQDHAHRHHAAASASRRAKWPRA